VIEARDVVATFQSAGTYFRAAADGVDNELAWNSLVLSHGQRGLGGPADAASAWKSTPLARPTAGLGAAGLGIGALFHC